MGFLLVFFNKSLKDDEDTTPHTAAHQTGASTVLLRVVCSLAALLGSVLASWYLVHHRSAGWDSSPWQLISPRFQIVYILFFGLWLIALYKQLLHPVAVWLSALSFISLSAQLFPLGFGFDIFVHEATVRAWMQQGSITPIGFLYNGFHALIAAIATTFPVHIKTILAWATPCIGATIITCAAKKTLPLLIFILFSELWITSTPQALGHFLLLGFVIYLFYEKRNSTTAIKTHLFIAGGIACIHPLSGIPAFAIVLWELCSKIKTTGLRHTSLISTFIFIALLPATLIAATSKQIIFSFPTATQFLHLFFIPPQSFHSFIITRLAYSARLCGPLIIILGALYGFFRHRQDHRRATQLFLSSLAIATSGILLLSIHVGGIISYEESGLSNRLLIAAYICMVPLATIGLTNFLARIPKINRRILLMALTCVAASSWYLAYPAWNTVQHSKNISVSPSDIALVKSIDEHAAHKPYVVLADQPTSAAALNVFGFTERQLPDRDFYFYPIPTGDVLYTKFFLPATYGVLTKKIIVDAARAANVREIFFVIKPYWEPTPAQITMLKNNSADWWIINGAYIGHTSIDTATTQ